MKEKIYKITLTTLTNLHIGSGETIETFDYYIKDNQFCYIDQDKLVDFLIEKDKEEEFTKTILATKRNQDRNIELILNKIGIQNLMPITKYCLNGLPEQKNNKAILTRIDGFIKNSLDRPFIPGSSIKGFISNCLGIDIRDKKDKLKGNLFSVSDSNELSPDDLWVTKNGYYNHMNLDVKDGIYKIGAKPGGKKVLKVNTGQSNYIEFIRPGTKIEFILKIKDNGYFDINKIKESIKKVNKNYQALYQELFYQTVQSDNITYDSLFKNDDYKSGDVFRLGKHTNFLLKTEHIKYYSDPEKLYSKLENLRLIRFPRMKKESLAKLIRHSEDYLLYPTALKVSKTPNYTYKENGVCAYDIEDITNKAEI
jgi:hypothetical protein